ncbi:MULTISPECIES: nucleoside recognition domain-containing protein [Tenebrionibacter/Tenebrionicola group]|uniref:YjiH family protein n=2 Tax=Tenebrionibacter/Tenebrionicola group TaxID=2969848 RepID=A0A8K0V6G6_9ENTR|nr:MULTISPECIES: nucleoside recognition domain-containing protein [Tenebrionibacter/Tenebrionicola group]MBK4715874.1 YjiH family protein [Tenebrionibacter intestinalis]MBV4411894.1 YjiH family protein [Tenebrionicola larvae]MBV5096633.1 YjiH family protein [Tenebrionicola larvae]
MTTPNTTLTERVGPGAWLALGFAVIFFSGMLGGNQWYGIFDFTTLNGAFGRVVSSASINDGTLATTTSAFRGVGGHGAMDGFLFALGLIPAVMFALGTINVLEHYGALKAARRLLTPLLRPLLGLPGSAGLAMIGSMQSTDVGASLTRNLKDEGELDEDERDVFSMFQFSAGAMITNFFSSGAILFTLMLADGSSAVPTSIGACIAVMFIMKIVGANILRFILKFNRRRSAQGEAA